MGRPLLHAIGMFKNEAGNIRRTLESARPHVDSMTIVDTGSEDDTFAIAEKVAGAGALVFRDRAFAIDMTRSFAESRNHVLGTDAARDDAPVFTIMLSGDEVLEDGAELRAFLESKRDATDGAYSITMRAGSTTWPYPRVFRTGGGWKYIGRVHELPVGPGGETVAPPCPGRIVHTVTDPKRRARRIRDFDVPVLTEIVADESYTLAERCRAIYFLADSHTALAAEHSADEKGGPWLTHQMTAMSLYWRCGQLMEESASPAHDHAKALLAYFFYFHIADKVGLYTNEELFQRVQALTVADPRQPEARFLLAKCAALIDPRRGLFLAEEASRVAREEREKIGTDEGRHVPTDARIEWTALHIAATCAKDMKNEDRARSIAGRAVAVGGPWEMFAEFMK